VTITKLAQRFLMNADSRKYQSPPELRMPEGIGDMAFAQPEPGRTHAFFINTEDKFLIATIVSFIPGINIVSTEFLSPESKTDEWQNLLDSADKCVALITPETMADVVLQQQIETALDRSKDVVLIHDLRQANEFSDILSACPKSLQDKGVFDHLAIALYGGDYEHVSLKLLWQRLSSTEEDGNGGVRKNSNMFSRNSVVMPFPQPAFPQKSFLGNPLSGELTDSTEAKANPKKEDEARLEEVTSADKSGGAESNPESANPGGREQRLNSVDTLLLEADMK
jgi:hypothetical protein